MSNIQLSQNKTYITHNLDNVEIFTGYLEDYEIEDSILKRLSKDLGFSYDTYLSLRSLDNSIADAMVRAMVTKSNKEKVVFLVDTDSHEIIDYTLEYERMPILNSEFIHRTLNLLSTPEELAVAEVYYHKEDKISSIIVKRKSPIVIEEKYMNRESNYVDYSIGVLITNDETVSSYCRLVLYVDDQPLYLPTSYYNSTTSRYKRSTSSSTDALEVLILKVIDDLRGDMLVSKLYDLHYRYRVAKNYSVSYEEYNRVLRSLRKVPTIIEDNSVLDSLVSKYKEFEDKYNAIEDQSSSYIWRCTALGDISLSELVTSVISVLNSVSAPSMEYANVRELLGEYISTNRNSEEIAKESIR